MHNALCLYVFFPFPIYRRDIACYVSTFDFFHTRFCRDAMLCVSTNKALRLYFFIIQHTKKNFSKCFCKFLILFFKYKFRLIK